MCVCVCAETRRVPGTEFRQFRLKTGVGSSQLGLKGNERSGFAADEG